MTTGRAMGVGVRERVRDAARRLAEAGVPSPRNDAEVLAAHVLGVRRTELVTAPEPPSSFVDDYAKVIERRAGREPLQHITGEAHFRRVTLGVGPGVFVPRPETELTAGAAIAAARAVGVSGRVPVVVDLYAGSGAIAISVAVEVRSSVVHAVESEPAACDWLRRNAADHVEDRHPGRLGETAEAAERHPGGPAGQLEDVREEAHGPPSDTAEAAGSLGRPPAKAHGERSGRLIVHQDDVGGCTERSMSASHGSVDVVVANPPYIPVGAVVRDPEVAAHDPSAALWSGADGLDAMRTLEPVAATLLRPGGLVVVEHADVQGTSAPAVFTGTGRWTDVTDHTDLNGRPRYLTARLVA